MEINRQRPFFFSDLIALVWLVPGPTMLLKNHWDSCVQKKLESYMASGMLSQFQGFPSQSMPTSSRTPKCSGDNKADDISEGSTFVRRSQSSVVVDQKNEPSAEVSKAAPAPTQNVNPPCDLSPNNIIQHYNNQLHLCSDKDQGQNDLSSPNSSKDQNLLTIC